MRFRATWTGFIVIAAVVIGAGVQVGMAQSSRDLADAVREATGEPTDEELRSMVGRIEYASASEAGDFDPDQVELGRLLFHDKIISGNQNISCSTCHHVFIAEGDGLSLSVGEGGIGLGVTRETGDEETGIVKRMPRNTPPTFNLGLSHVTALFWDGRIETSSSNPQDFRTPFVHDAPEGLDSMLSALPLLPVITEEEMAGNAGENPIADAALVGDFHGAWAHIADRLRAIPEYVDLFARAFDDVNSASDITYVHAANAISAFMKSDLTFTDSPFDRFLEGDGDALTSRQRRGMYVFYQTAGCGQCHSGRFQTDMDFHAIAMPQIGPGKGNNAPGYGDGRDDFGRERVTGREEDRYKFRTPTLRNVELTGPYGHAGAYPTLEAVVEHHLEPVRSLYNYDTSQAVLPSRPDLDAIDFTVMNDPARVEEIAERNELRPVELTDEDFEALMAFLRSLTDRSALQLQHIQPTSVPSGLPVYD